MDAPDALPYPATPPHERDDLPPLGPGAASSVGSRFVARLVDYMVISLPLYLWLVQPYVKTVGGTLQMNLPTWAQLTSVIVPLVYETIAVAAFGTTIGKAVMRLRVVRYVDGGRLLPYQAAMRASVPNVPSFLAYLPGVEFIGLLAPVVYLSAVIDPLARGLHDKAAGSIVLRTR